MATTYQSASVPGTMLSAIRSLVDPSTQGIRFAVAYCTRTGVRELVEALSDTCGQGWGGLDKKLVTSFDFGITEPAAIELLHQVGFEVYVAGQSPQGIAIWPSVAFHPKIYIVDNADGCRALIGSANLTGRALTINTESGFTLDGDPALESAWEQILGDARLVDSALLAEYKAARPSKPIVKADPKITHLPKPVAGVNAFGDTVEAGDVVPDEFEAFWIETGSMSSGGSRNQLELPRHANQFFGFNETDYDSDQHTIGTPHLRVRGRDFTNRRLTWHGNNRMERLNLPTGSKGGYRDYANKVLLFRRSPRGFVIEVASPASDTAQSWVDASVAAGHIFALGHGSPRTCGLIDRRP